MRTGFRRVTKKIGEILYLAVSSNDFNQNPLATAKYISNYQYNQEQQKDLRD
jgi:hypothetical protein